MIYDNVLDIAVGDSLKTVIWSNKKIMWSELVEKLMTENKTEETYKEYMSFSKAKQTAIKDVGGYVGGFLLQGKRSPQTVLHRQLVTLDLDDGAYEGFWDDFVLQYNCAAVIHGTHKWTPDTPRYRLILPLSREVSPEEYGAISRRIAGNLGIELFDNTTFQVNRLMFWPSNPKDISYFADSQDGPWLDADEVLNTYDNWQDITQWPTSDKLQQNINKSISKQTDPEEKEGIIGAFCKVYSITAAIDTFLSEVYSRLDSNRYTYNNGSTAGGLVVYNDKFAYSHHSTDPAAGRLCNAFDLVRLHKFGHLDLDSKVKKESAKKSFKEMEKLLVEDKNVKKQILAENTAKADFDLADPLDDEWLEELELNKDKTYKSSAQNITMIFKHDENIQNRFAYNAFDKKYYTMGSLPWRQIFKPEPLRDLDLAGIRNYIEILYGIVSSTKIDDAMQLEMEKNSFNPVQDFITAHEWDGEKRVETLFIDYFGAKDSIYTREAAKIFCTAAVARIFQPGIKFDLVITIIGQQGTGKSTFFKKLGGRWFSDTFISFSGKDAFEQLQGAWIVELAELAGLKKSDIETVKQFISKSEDMFRPAYKRVVETFPRQCVFVGTTNESDFLQDPSGNRRFIPIDTDMRLATKSIFNDLTEDEVHQIWAEAYQLYKDGQQLYMTKEAEVVAKIEQEKHSEFDERVGLIREYLATPITEDWDSKDLYDRQEYYRDPFSVKGNVRRDYVCIAEIWTECLGKNLTDINPYNTREINKAMYKITDWEKVHGTKRFKLYGTQRYYKRIEE